MNRYMAQMRLGEIGEEGQKRLSDARILIIGCGALGSPVAMYLAGAGVGHITIADFDTVDLSNLHRQVFYKEHEVGSKKVDCLKKNMITLNSQISVEIWDKLVTRKLLEDAGGRFNFIVDGADNPSTTYMLDAYCSKYHIPLSIAGISEWTAQIFFYSPGSITYGEIFTQPNDNSGILPCSIAGIAGPIAAFAASIQAADVIKYLAGITTSEPSRLITANLLSNKIDIIRC